MGFKLDALIVEKAGQPPEAALAELVGGPLRARGRLSLDDALSPEPPLAGGAFGSSLVLFLGEPLTRLISGQAPALEARLTRAFRGREVLALHLESTRNSYGWARWSKAGKRVRTRVGDYKAVHLDQGKPLAPEKAALAGSKPRGKSKRLSHDQLGESVVFALLEAAAGVRPDRDDLPRSLARFTYPRSRFVLEVEREVGVANPRPDQLQSALRALRPEGPSFAILVGVASESYVQAGGAGARMVVEGRLVKGTRFRHASAGRAQRAGATPKQVPMSGGPLTVPANEVLKVGDALRIFNRFLAKQDLDPAYAWRDRTAEFKG